MAKSRLKVFKTHIGFYDLLVAAPSMKAAAEAWNSDTKIFSQGFAARTENTDEVKAALTEPGTVLKRPHGEKSAWQVEAAAIPTPKVSKKKKQDVAKAHKKKAAEEQKEKIAAEKRARKDAAAELAEIERQESELRQKRQALQKKFRLHSVK